MATWQTSPVWRMSSRLPASTCILHDADLPFKAMLALFSVSQVVRFPTQQPCFWLSPVFIGKCMLPGRWAWSWLWRPFSFSICACVYVCVKLISWLCDAVKGSSYHILFLWNGYYILCKWFRWNMLWNSCFRPSFLLIVCLFFFFLFIHLQTMAKVITSILKFPPEQAQKVLDKEDSKTVVSITCIRSHVQLGDSICNFNKLHIHLSAAMVTMRVWFGYFLMKICCYCCWGRRLPWNISNHSLSISCLFMYMYVCVCVCVCELILGHKCDVW